MPRFPFSATMRSPARRFIRSGSSASSSSSSSTLAAADPSTVRAHACRTGSAATIAAAMRFTLAWRSWLLRASSSGDSSLWASLFDGVDACGGAGLGCSCGRVSIGWPMRPRGGGVERRTSASCCASAAAVSLATLSAASRSRRSFSRARRFRCSSIAFSRIRRSSSCGSRCDAVPGRAGATGRCDSRFNAEPSDPSAAAALDDPNALNADASVGWRIRCGDDVSADARRARALGSTAAICDSRAESTSHDGSRDLSAPSSPSPAASAPSVQSISDCSSRPSAPHAIPAGASLRKNSESRSAEDGRLKGSTTRHRFTKAATRRQMSRCSSSPSDVPPPAAPAALYGRTSSSAPSYSPSVTLCTSARTLDARNGSLPMYNS
mmetsp:Transcript_10306/g.31873  ORF Transcript_10306/g.31873 Transcript_10306/m.31873 type:complete len:380 (-) Transcript_10306:730-1869(-)